ncbi:MAG: C40 family peptidase, partial [Solobacterium sp.]|nr:C40 family peptidase [Solobacterium sp.]
NKKLNQILSETSCQLENNSGNTVVEGELSNGDVVTYSCAFDPSKLKKAHVNIPETSVSFTVEGLNDPAPINLFEDVILYGEADEESGAVYLYAEPRDKKFREVYYNVVSEDENGILVYADISDDLLLKYGLVAEDHYHTYPQSALPEDIQQLVREEIIRTSIGQAAASRDEYGREIANGSNADINALAQSFLGRGGACNEIANAFIYALYGVRVHTGYSLDNLYPVDTPEAGDLIYYYDTAGNYRHVATYIGNGLVLNGNYGDGTAHITSMYESWYANNPMTYLRVAR